MAERISRAWHIVSNGSLAVHRLRRGDDQIAASASDAANPTATRGPVSAPARRIQHGIPHDWKGSANLDRIRPRGLAEYGRMCGWTLARAHARCGERIAIASYLGSASRFDEAIAAFAETYADQSERDDAALVDAVAARRLEATPGL